MKAFFKWLGIGVLVIILGASAWGTHEWNAEKPFSFRVFLDRTLIKQALKSPETLTSIGVLDGIGIKGHNAHLDDASLASSQDTFDELMEIKNVLMQYEDLDEEQQLSKDIALYLLNTLGGFEKYQYHSYPFNQMSGAQSNFPSFMDGQHPITDAESVDFYVSRLSESKRYFTQMLEGMKLREEKNILPPRFVIQRVIDEMQGFIDKPVKENILYTSVQRRMKESDEIVEADYDGLLSNVATEIENTVYPTYQMLIDYFTGLKPKAGTDDGLWHLEGGDEAYKLALRFFTTTDYSADYIHNVGLSEVDRIQAEILAILAQEGFDISQGFTAAINTLAEDERFYYPDTDEGREQILADYQTILDEIDAGLGDAFLVRPEAGMEVKRIPEFKEKTAPGAYYEAPAFDGSRAGVFFANLYDIKATPTYSMRTLAYHEGIPGHHFQIAIAMELEGLPIFRTVAPFVAYIEGWALYSERLAWELGFQNDPFDNIGRLQAELFRAVRLVVDTGIHAKRWTREEAIDYMLANTGMAESDVTSEIERYIVMPGQATSYKVGMMKIFELREKAKVALGDKFVLGEFHDAVLKNGAVPLDVLEQIVDGYIDDTLN
ncbi:DUF885 domain-containing protein [Alteromonas stellipolaris]|uniref:DUF885 domain-containing protein n=1 Tax=Alteromonas stellipolaris TaxID=233316 RepID=UPI00211783FD|nr:DUF885 domain-containing protein [Alteromonas stellipolaris]MCQ8848142.1 DUF885 domain-containing protein [Alteromonas stellipolaris]